MWRSESWKNPYYLEDIDSGFYNQYPEFSVFEAGADAIGKAIREELQCILDNNSSDQDKLNQLASFVEKL